MHFHRLDAVAATLDAAARHFGAVSGRTAGLLGALLLTQTATERVFEHLQGLPATGDWRLAPAASEPQTLLAQRGTSSLAIVCGRQVRAGDGLEVLALGTLERFADGLPLADAVAEAMRSGALTVIPWGFGKWLGSRGHRVSRLLESLSPADVFLGDNGGRLAWLGRPRLIRAGEARGFRVLPGTDPFPFARGYRRVGAFGFLADIEPPGTAPWNALRAWLQATPGSPRAFGRAAGLLSFAFCQVGIQAYNRLPDRGPQ